MKKILVTFFVMIQMSTGVFAGGDVEPLETEEVEVFEEESRFYIVAKGLMILGDSTEHGEALLKGDRDYGFGIDFGYRIGNGFALEYDFSFSKNRVLETKPGHTPEYVDADYTTSALDIVYVFEVTERVGLFVKAGYEYEWEEIEDLGIDSKEHGFVLGVGTEVAMNEKFKF
ncbi:MAG TPA: porin family protein, partial [Candidatus Atribacteria bacterium]|nr:porin family protein [Candidatus Atribacteria bacterium]